MEHGLIDTYDEYDFDFASPVHPVGQTIPARQIPPFLRGPASPRNSRGR